MHGVVDVGGHSSVPEALYWFHKAKRANQITQKQIQLMKNCEEIGSQRCHYCKISSATYQSAHEGEMPKASAVTGRVIIVETVSWGTGPWATKRIARQNIS